jgi:hypothetical protein
MFLENSINGEVISHQKRAYLLFEGREMEEKANCRCS